MAKKTYTGINGVARDTTNLYKGISSVSRNIVSGYTGVSGVARQFLESGTPISSLAVGSTVYMKVNGVSTAFLVVHQGLPSSTYYDSSCDGTWLLMKDIYENRVWDSTNNDYANSDIHAWLNGTFLNLFEVGIKGAIKQVKIPYTQGTGSGGSVKTGSNGLSAKAFLLSYTESGAKSGSNVNTEGATLTYFLDSSVYDWTVNNHWFRSPVIDGTTYASQVTPFGTFSRSLVNNSSGIRPAFILPTNLLINDNFEVIV